MTKLAIDGGTPIRTKGFQEWPVYDELEEKLLLEVLHSGKWGGAGEVKSPEFQAKLPEFIESFTNSQGAKYGVTVANGTMAITIALKACGVRPGDEVIMPSYTFIATATSALIYGVIPVFVDVDENTLQIDPEKIEEAITSKTKAIVPVHLGGAIADMTRINEIAKKHNLKVVEDAAQVFGATWEGNGAGTLGDMGTFSFQSSKNITAGEGGMILTNDEELIDRAWSFANVGRVRDGAWYQHEEIGLNLRMTEFQAAILLAQMTRAREQLLLREKNAKLLNRLLQDVQGVKLLERDKRITNHAYHIYMLKLDPELGRKVGKEKVIEQITAEGIPVTSGYVPLHKNEAVLREIKELTGENPQFNCPLTERLAENEVIWVRQSIMMSDEEMIYDVAKAFKKVLSFYY